jgi:hypothetical protein
MSLRDGNIRVRIVPHDGRPNPNNPYDKLSPEDRRARLRQILAKIALRNADKYRAQNEDGSQQVEDAGPGRE